MFSVYLLHICNCTHLMAAFERYCVEKVGMPLCIMFSVTAVLTFAVCLMVDLVRRFALLSDLQLAVLDGYKSYLFHFLFSIKKLSFHYTGGIAFWVYRVISRFSLEVFLHLVAAQRLRRNCRSDSIGFVHTLLYLIAWVFYTKPLRFTILTLCGLLY